jgi:signal transduction histidine kinase/ActR/RegA family two-component response regulator
VSAAQAEKTGELAGGAIEVRPGSAAAQSLEAQAALLPYALAAFAVGLPIFAWVCSFADDRYWMTASLAIFAINWAAFYGVVDWMKRHPEGRDDTALRTRVHILGGLLWSMAVVQITLLGLAAGPAREPMLLMAFGAATLCVFFSAPCLPTLLIVAPAACAPPILALYANPATQPAGQITLAAAALALALSLILNRLLRGLFILAGDRERLMEERAESLVQARKLARSKSDLVATLSNEIRNGLTGVADVLSAASGAAGRAAPSREQLTAALGSARDLITVLNATLDSETAEAGRLSVARRPYDPAALARDLVLLLSPAAAAKGLELAIHVDEPLDEPEAGAVVGDVARARQVLSNLVDNAIKYTVRGRIEVRVEQPAENRLRFAVADTGPGLSEEELERAFEAFGRVERTGAGVPGAGLGLSLARRLTELMDGEVSVQSALGVGSCFKLELPFNPAARVEAPAEPAPRPIPHGRSRQFLRVLIAEPDALQAAMLRSVLEQLGHQVVHAQSGRRARDLAKTCDFDLMVLNGRVAEVNGPGAIQSIRRLDAPAARAAIIAVIDGDAEDARLCREAGANAVMRRPINVANVARTVAEAMRDAKDRQTGEPHAKPALTVVERAS